MKQTYSAPFLFLALLFCVSLIISNILEVKIVQLGLITATGGLIVFPISYICNDCIAEVYGYRKARVVIWLGFVLNLLAVAFIQASIWLPAAPFWEHQTAFQTIFMNTPRILAASFTAFIVGSFINAYVMSKMKIAQKGKHFSIRAIASTLVGESADSIIFFPIAFGGIVSPKEIMMLIITQAFLKTAYEIVILPITIVIVKRLKRIEGIDTFDNDISYNVFKN